MAKGPDLSDPKQNPDYENHVSNVSNMIGSANGNQRINGIGWYRRAAQDVSHIAIGMHPGTMQAHSNPEWAERGISQDKPGSSTMGSQFIRNQLSEARGNEMDHALSLGQSHAESLARSGRYEGQRSSAINDAGRPFGMVSHNPATRDIATSVAAMSPAGPTGMTWDNNPRAVADAKNLNEDQFRSIAKANTFKPGTPERKAASEEARVPFKGTALNHQTTPNVEKGVRALNGDYRGQDHPLGMQKTQHFANDIYNEFAPEDPENRSGMTGTVDKHQEDVLAGVTKPWGTTEANGDMNRTASVRTAGENGLPKLSSDKGYAYQRGVVQEASKQRDLRPKEGQAISWVTQKASKDAAKRGR